MKKITIKYSIIDEDGCPSRSYECTAPYVYYFDKLQEDLDSAIELFKYRQEKYRTEYMKRWNKDPFEEFKNESN